MLKDSSSREDPLYDGFETVWLGPEQSVRSLVQVAAVSRREGFAVCGCLLCLEVEVEGVHRQDSHFHEVDYELARKTLCQRPTMTMP